MSEESHKTYAAFFDVTITKFNPYQPDAKVNIEYTMAMTGSTDPKVFKFGPDNKITITLPKKYKQVDLTFRVLTPDYIFVGLCFEIPPVPYDVNLPKLKIEMEKISGAKYCIMTLTSSGALENASYDYLMILQQYTTPGYVIGIIDPDIEIKASEVELHPTDYRA